jgi:hypothetical protein
LAQASAATVAASSTAALPVSVRRNRRSGVSSRCAHTVRSENGEPAAVDSVTSELSRPRSRPSVGLETRAMWTSAAGPQLSAHSVAVAAAVCRNDHLNREALGLCAQQSAAVRMAVGAFLVAVT